MNNKQQIFNQLTGTQINRFRAKRNVCVCVYITMTATNRSIEQTIEYTIMLLWGRREMVEICIEIYCSL